MLGIDVSLWQGVIDWKKVAASGVRFAVIKATQKTFTDPQFKRNQMWARATMQIVGYYHFFNLGPSPEAQADYFVNTIGPLRVNEFVVLDWEERGLSPAVYKDQALRWLQRVHSRTGKRPYIYTSPSLAEQGQFGSWGKDYPLWVAHWGTNKPRVPPGWSNWQMWQYSAKGKVPGISGDVDMNIMNNSFDLFTMLLVGGAVMFGLAQMWKGGYGRVSI